MSKRIHVRLHELPERSVTTLALNALDFIVPGEWKNVNDFREMIAVTTGVTDQEDQNEIARKAIGYYDSDDEHYQTAMRLFELVDSLDKAASVMAAANKIGENFNMLGFMERWTPKADTTQAIDAGLKLIVEVINYFLLYGWPKDGGVGAFVDGLKSYGKDELMRLTAWIVFDGIVPLGPDFMRKVTDAMNRVSSDELGNNKIYKAIESYIPGTSASDKQNFIQKALVSSQAWITDFVQKRGITQEKVVAKLQSVLNTADNSLDFLAAALDATTNYYEHTGTQTVARAVIKRAHKDIQQASKPSNQGMDAAMAAAMAAMNAAMGKK